MISPRMKTMVLVILFLFFLPICSISGNIMTIAYPEFYPFFSKTQNGKIEGFFYEILIEALEHRMEIPTEWFQMPWKRCQNQVRSGKIDAMITVPTEERLTYCDTHPDPFYLKELKLFTYKGHRRINEIQHIRSIADIKKGGYTIIITAATGGTQIISPLWAFPLLKQARFIMSGRCWRQKEEILSLNGRLG